MPFRSPMSPGIDAAIIAGIIVLLRQKKTLGDRLHGFYDIVLSIVTLLAHPGPVPHAMEVLNTSGEGS